MRRRERAEKFFHEEKNILNFLACLMQILMSVLRIEIIVSSCVPIIRAAFPAAVGQDSPSLPTAGAVSVSDPTQFIIYTGQHYYNQYCETMIHSVCSVCNKLTCWITADHDECAVDNGNCQQTCTNTAGSHTCGCNSGFRINNDGRTCRGELEADSRQCHLTPSLVAFRPHIISLKQ